MVMVVSINLWLFLNRKNERERINNVMYCMMVIVGYIILSCRNIILMTRIRK